MDDDVKVLERIYDRFNARDIDGVLTVLTDDVAWANGMDGGHVHGREAVRDLEGKPLQGQTHGLKDKTVGHVFRLREGKVARFDIQDAVGITRRC
jgi:ketosteroid isomerase-like protein